MSLPEGPEQPPPPVPGIPEELCCKSRLQEYTQRASIPLPVYKTLSEGTQHAFYFRSRVWVDGACFISPTTFSSKKMAEQDAAKHALVGVLEKVKNEGSSRICEDTIFCKSIINEYALKMNLNIPTYVTNESKAMLPIFVSSLVLGGGTFVGAAGKNKKEAEQFAARSAILSILESESSTTMSEIVKSKFKFYDSLKKFRDSSNCQGATIPLEVLKGSTSVQACNVPTGELSLVDKTKEVDVSGGPTIGSSAATTMPRLLASSPAIQLTIPESTTEQISTNQATHQAIHEFEKPICATASVALDPPIVFVAPASEQAQMYSTSCKKRKRKKKRKAQRQSTLLAPYPAMQPTIPESALAQLSTNQTIQQSLHEFKNPESGTSSVAMYPPTVFVPPASEQALLCSTSGKKLSRKRRKAKKKAQCQSVFSIAVPQGPLPACLVPQ